MARIRSIKPEFFRHERLQDLEAAHPGKYPMLVFEGLWTVSDKAGRFEWKPRLLKLDILPFLPFDMEETLSILQAAEFVQSYEIEGKLYGYIPTFLDHQRITGTEAMSPERYPAPTKESIKKQQGNNKETTRKDGTGNTEKEKEKEREKENIKAAEQEPFRLPLKEEIEHASKAMTLESINRVSDELYKSGKWKDVHACKNKLLKECKNERAILHALIRIYLKDPPPDEPWAYCVQIMKQEDGNFNARDYEKNQGRSS